MRDQSTAWPRVDSGMIYAAHQHKPASAGPILPLQGLSHASSDVVVGIPVIFEEPVKVQIFEVGEQLGIEVTACEFNTE